MPDNDATNEPRTATQQLVRLSVNMNPETAEALKEFAANRHLSYTEAVRRAIAIAKYLDDEVSEGRKVQTVDPDRSDIRELILI